MMPESLFNAAFAKTDPAERAAYLDGACLGQPELRQVPQKSTWFPDMA